MIKRGVRGSGLTAKPVVSFNDDADLADPEVAAAVEQSTLDGMISATERACFAILLDAGLPGQHGCYLFNSTGEWRKPGPPFRGWGIANTVAPIARARGFAPDSRVGFASEILDRVYWLRDAQRRGDHDRAALFAFYIGVLKGESGIKERHGAKSRPAQPSRKNARDVELAREYQRRRTQSKLSDSALKADIGARSATPLKRSSAIEAINRGLKILSG